MTLLSWKRGPGPGRPGGGLLRRFAPRVTIQATPEELRVASPPHELTLPASIWLHPDGRIASAEEAGARCTPLFDADVAGEPTRHERVVALLRIAFRQVRRHQWLPVRPAVTFGGLDQLAAILGDDTRDILERAAYDAGALSVDFQPRTAVQGSSGSRS